MRMMRARRYWRSPALGFISRMRVADDAVGVVVEVGAGRGERGDDAALDERDEAALVQARPASSRRRA